MDGLLLGTRPEGIAGEGILATITFQARAEGNPAIRFGDVLVRDSENQPLTFETTTEATPGSAPTVTALLRTPNPLRRGGQFAFTLAAAAEAQFVIFGVDGRRVRTLTQGAHAAGLYRFAWDGRDDAGNAVSSGIFYAQLRTGSGRFTNKVVYLR